MMIYFLILIHSTQLFASNYFGTILKNSSGEFEFQTNSNNVFKIQTMNHELLNSINSLHIRKASILLPINKDDTIIVKSAPTISKGEFFKSGILKMNSGDFFLDNEKVTFRPGKPIDGTQFDELSKQSFLDKRILTQGNFVDGIYEISSLVEADIFSTKRSLSLIGSDHAKLFHQKFVSDPLFYILEKMPQPKRSKSVHSFRGTIFDYGKKISPGDSVMLLTMSGHQGDSPISANGHIAAGLGIIQNDETIKGEIYNLYITPINRKEIISGSNNWIDYFGHIIGGQNNYRPTYTLVLYGIDKNKLLYVREILENYHSFFRLNENQFTVGVNCGTLSVKALAKIGIYGFQRNKRNGNGRFGFLPNQYQPINKMSPIQQLVYTLTMPMEEYMPRNIWESIIQNLEYLNEVENLGIHRADFIYYAQTPSARVRGGIASNSLSDELLAFILGKHSTSVIKTSL